MTRPDPMFRADEIDRLSDGLRRGLRRRILVVYGVTGAVVAVVLLLLLGCSTPRPQRGGHARIAAADTTLAQPENPAAPAVQTRVVSNVVEWISPTDTLSSKASASPSVPGDAVRAPAAAVVFPSQRAPSPTVSGPHPTTVPPGLVRQVYVEETRQELGAAHRDATRELAARAASLKPAQYLGFVLLVAALAMFHPAVAAVVGSRTTQAATGVVGLMLILSPAVVPGHERWLMVTGVVLVLVWWLAHRHGELRGKVRS